MSGDTKPHCERCDYVDCDGMPLPGTEESFEAHAGIKPQAPIMRSSWEHNLMVWCKAKWHEWNRK